MADDLSNSILEKYKEWVCDWSCEQDHIELNISEKLTDMIDKSSHLGLTLKEHFYFQIDEFIHTYKTLFEKCESPIEVKLLEALFLTAPSYGRSIGAHQVVWNITDNINSQNLHIFPQFEMALEKKYRADFLLVTNDTIISRSNKDHRGATRRLFIECDGHDYHERTKEQAIRDKSRDRDFVMNDHTIMRFTGSEIYHNPFKCAESIMYYMTCPQWVD